MMALEIESTGSDGGLRSPSPMVDVERPESAPPSPPSPPPVILQQQPQPLRLTNFFISEILKPDFGSCGRVSKKPKHHIDLYVNPGVCLGLHHHPGSSLSDSPRKLDPDCVSYHPGHLSPAHSTTSTTSSTSSCTTSPTSKHPAHKTQHCSSGLPDIDELSSPDKNKSGEPILWPAWVYCTRYSDRPSSGELAF